MRHLIVALVLALLSAGSAQAQDAVDVRARPITQFEIGSSETRFGDLTFVGGLEMAGRGDFGGISAFRYRAPGGDFVAVTDTGFWIFGRVTRDDEGRPEAWSDVTMEPITGPGGEATSEKWFVDAEGMALQGEEALVSFERVHRISRYRLNPGSMGRQTEDLDFLVPENELRMNRGFETVAIAPADGPLTGSVVAVTEKSLDANGDIFGAVLSGPRKGVFSVARSDEFDITDGTFLPDGDLLLLERRFNMATGVAMRIRRIKADQIRPGTLIEGEIILTADMSFQIDNMEGLDAWRHADGTTRIALVSDDNLSILQRNLYLEFIYDPQP